MKWNVTTLIYRTILIAAAGMTLLLSACSDRPSHNEAIIEETSGGEDILAQEFETCDEGYKSENPLSYVQFRSSLNNSSTQQQSVVEQQFPMLYSSLGQSFPLRGSWRQSKSEILDLVDRHVWSPELRRPVEMLHYFDMLLLANISPRSDSTPSSKSAQRMQVLVRTSSSNDLKTWKRLEVWPISSGIPCGKKIETFTGVFKLDPTRIYSNYYSKLFEDAEMHETMFLYHQYQNGSQTGVALHGTYLTEKLGRRDSGGCIRLYRDKAKCLFDTITGKLSQNCLAGTKLDYWGKVPSFLPRNGEADPAYLSSGALEVSGYKVLIAFFNDINDEL